MQAALDAIISLGHGKSRQTLTASLPFDANTEHALGYRPGGPQHGDGAQGLVIKFGNEEGFSGVDFLPHLADLDTLSCHPCASSRIVRTPAGVNLPLGRTFPCHPRKPIYIMPHLIAERIVCVWVYNAVTVVLRREQ